MNVLACALAQAAFIWMLYAHALSRSYCMVLALVLHDPLQLVLLVFILYTMQLAHLPTYTLTNIYNIYVYAHVLPLLLYTFTVWWCMYNGVHAHDYHLYTGLSLQLSHYDWQLHEVCHIGTELVKHWYCRHANDQFEWRLMSLLMEIIKLPANNDLVKSY